MALTRGDIIDVYFKFPYQQGVNNTHPAIIISNETVYHTGDSFIVVMLTHSEIIDEFTFEIKPEMLINKTDERFSQVRCHLITQIFEDQVNNLRARNRIRNSLVVDQIASQVYNRCFLSEDDD